MFQQILDLVGGSLVLSALSAAIPLVTLFILLGGLRMKAWMAGLISLAVALFVAVVLFEMPFGQALLAGSEGAAFGFFPILWIVINAIWVYNLTVETGHFGVLRRSFELVSPDHRIQAIIIAFCFGALLEALAGFGTPVAITVVMLLALGFEPIKAAAVALIANTAPVAFGALATPIVTLAEVTSGVNNDPRLNIDTLGGMVGRQTPILAVIVPLVLVLVVDGKRGLRQTWLPALVAGLSFGVAQFVAANYISVPLTDIVASLVAAAAVVGLLRVWKPAEAITTAETETTGAAGGAGGAASRRGQPGLPARCRERARWDRPDGGRHGRRHRRPGQGRARRGREGLRAVPGDHRDLLDRQHPRGQGGPRPGAVDLRVRVARLEVANSAGEPLASTTFNFNWFPAAGTLMIFAGIITALILKISPARALKTYAATYHELRWAIVTVMAVLALAYVMNLSGQTTTLGVWLAGTGGLFVLLADPRLDRGRGDRLGHLRERALRRPPGADRGPGRARPGPARRGELLGRRDGQDGQPAEPRHRGGRGGHGGPGGRHLPQGAGMEPAAGDDVPDRLPAVDARARVDGSLASQRWRTWTELQRPRTRVRARAPSSPSTGPSTCSRPSPGPTRRWAWARWRS